MNAADIETIKQRILEHCEEYQGRYVDTPCLVWTGWKEWDGYGRIKYRGRKWRVHRLAYECWVEPIPEGMQVNHICHATDCCRPEHLKLGTVQSNSDDMIRDGRSCPGEANAQAGFWNEHVAEILQMTADGWPLSSIARKFGVGKSAICDIVHGKTYKDVPGPRIAVSKPTNRFFGVYKGADKWIARLLLDGKPKHLGYFAFEIDAAICVNAHIAYLGLDRPLNIIPEGEWCHD